MHAWVSTGFAWLQRLQRLGHALLLLLLLAAAVARRARAGAGAAP
jgi:hypothetical protein